MVSVDSASSELVCLATQAAHARRIAGLMAVSVRREMLGVLSTLTPPGWTKPAAGACSGTLVSTDFSIRAVDSWVDQPA